MSVGAIERKNETKHDNTTKKNYFCSNLMIDRVYFKLWISDIHLMLSSPIQEKAYIFRGKTVERVIIFGTITKVKTIGTKILYEVDDGTGNINCIFNHCLMMDPKMNKLMNDLNFTRIKQCKSNETDGNYEKTESDDEISAAITSSLNWLTKEVYKYGKKTKTIFDVGDTVCAKGRINDFFGQREIQIYQLHLIDNLKDETGHILDFVNLYRNEYCNF